MNYWLDILEIKWANVSQSSCVLSALRVDMCSPLTFSLVGQQTLVLVGWVLTHSIYFIIRWYLKNSFHNRERKEYGPICCLQIKHEKLWLSSLCGSATKLVKLHRNYYYTVFTKAFCTFHFDDLHPRKIRLVSILRVPQPTEIPERNNSVLS